MQVFLYIKHDPKLKRLCKQQFLQTFTFVNCLPVITFKQSLPSIISVALSSLLQFAQYFNSFFLPFFASPFLSFVTFLFFSHSVLSHHFPYNYFFFLLVRSILFHFEEGWKRKAKMNKSKYGQE